MIAPRHRENLIQRAQRDYAQGRFTDALETGLELLAEAPRDADALLLAGLAAASQRQPGHALAWLKAATRERPNDAQCWYELGVTAAEAAADEALDAYGRCLCLQPRHVDALTDLAGLFYARGEAHAALPLVERALKEKPGDARLVLFMAKALHDLRRLDEAERWYEKALALTPGDPKLQWEYAMQLLLTGRYENGWEYYDARVPAFGYRAVTQYPFPYRPWRGEPLAGATLLVHGEQGLGDEIMFASIVPEMIAEAKKVVLACSPSLMELFRRSFPGAAVEALDRGPAAVAQWRPEGPHPAWLAKQEPIHLHCSLGSCRDSGARHARPSRCRPPT
jgi:Flp pilus assembly protein TadD